MNKLFSIWKREYALFPSHFARARVNIPLIADCRLTWVEIYYEEI